MWASSQSDRNKQSKPPVGLTKHVTHVMCNAHWVVAHLDTHVGSLSVYVFQLILFKIAVAAAALYQSLCVMRCGQAIVR